MTTLPDLARRALQACAVSVLLALAACGPGTGGTGTGPISGVFNYAGPGFSTGLPCALDCPGVTLRLEAERVEFTAACRRFIYTGPWELDEQGVVVLEGTLETTEVIDGQARTTSQPAVMRLQFSEAAVDSSEVSLTLRDATGANLLAPVTLQQGTRAAAPPACGGGQ